MTKEGPGLACNLRKYRPSLEPSQQHKTYRYSSNTYQNGEHMARDKK